MAEFIYQMIKARKAHGEKVILDDVTLAFYPGAKIGVVGPNGAGKSTMMKIITCYIPPTSGKVTVCGFDVMEQSTQAKKCIGYLPELNPLYTDMYVREYLSFVGGMYHIQNLKSRVEEMIETVGLQPEAHKKIETITKGYNKRVRLPQARLH